MRVGALRWVPLLAQPHFYHSISIFSPGRLYDGLTLSELQQDHYRSRLRNKLVAEAFYLTTGIEKYGSGFIRIRQALRDYPEVQFTVEELSGGLCLTFAKPAAEEGGGVKKTTRPRRPQNRRHAMNTPEPPTCAPCLAPTPNTLKTCSSGFSSSCTTSPTPAA